MVAEAEAVGDLSIEERHRLGGYFPLVVVIGLGDVALVKDKGYVELAGVVANPACLADDFSMGQNFLLLITSSFCDFSSTYMYF